MNIGNVVLSGSATITNVGTVWKEKSRWWNSMCSNKLFFDKNHREIRHFPGGNITMGFGTWELDSSKCQVIVEPIEND